LRNVLILVSALATGASVFRQVQLLRRGEIHPSIITWGMFWVAIMISFVANQRTPGGDALTNITNTSDVLGVTVMVVALTTTDREDKWKLHWVDLVCLAGLAGVLVFWWIRRDEFATHLTAQFIMVVAYWPTLNKVWRAGRNTESFQGWGLTWLASASGLAVAVIGDKILPIIYAARSAVLTMVLLGLMTYLELRPRNRKQ